MNKKLIDWSKNSFPELPWRNTRSLFTTLVSEIMLQQTTVSTVQNHFGRFIKQYPSIKSLALATEEELLIAWKGLGYYRRAKNLKKACEYLLSEYQGQFPKTYEELIEIPGVGDYTASALLSIGMNKNYLAVDANLERVLARFYGIREIKGPKLQKKIKELFEDKKIAQNIKKFGGREFNEALMDLGRVFCQARKASCDLCPLASKCMALKSGDPLSFPIVQDSKKKLEKHNLKLLRVIVKDRKKLYVYKKNKGEWLHGQFEVPTYILETDDKKLEQYPHLDKKIKINTLKKFKTTITKYKIENYILELTPAKFKKDFPKLETGCLKPLDLENQNFSTATIKALKHIGS